MSTLVKRQRMIDSEPMDSFELTNETRETCVCSFVEVAGDLWHRMKGLLGRDGLPEGHGLLILSCNSIHTFFMRFPIDVVFLDGKGSVVRIRKDLKPFRCCSGGIRARMVLEMAAGEIDESVTRVGDRLRMDTRPPKG